MLRALTRTLRRRPRAAVLVAACLAVVVAGRCYYAYGVRQWHAGEVALREGRAAEARECLDTCLRVWPRSPAVHLLAARAARMTGDFDAAETHLNRCIRLNRGATQEVQLEFLLMRVQRGEVDAVAATLFNFVNNGHAESPVILETIAGAYLRDLRYGPALDCLNLWIERVPDSAQAYHWRGWVLERLDDSQSAVKDYLHALELKPDYAWVRLPLAELYLRRRKPEEALPHLEWLERQLPGRPNVMARLGQCRLQLGQRDEARRLLESAVQHLPDDTDLLLALSRLEVQDGRLSEAERCVRKILSFDPVDTEAQFALVNILNLQGRSEEAAAVLRQHEKDQADLNRAYTLLQQESTHPTKAPDGVYEIGAMFLRGHQERLGLYWLGEALRRDPGHRKTHELLATYYAGQGNNELASRHRAEAGVATNGR